jgi:hypothetical protein
LPDRNAAEVQFRCAGPPIRAGEQCMPSERFVEALNEQIANEFAADSLAAL